MKIIFEKPVFLLLFIFFSLSVLGQENENAGVISGTVIDKEFKDPIAGATVQIEGTVIGAVTDVDGFYRIENVKPGTYTLSVQYISYQSSRINNVTVKTGQTTIVDVQLIGDSESLDEVVVSAQVSRNTETAIVNNTQHSYLVQSGVSAQQIIKAQDRDASEVIRRIPGISVLDDKFVMVRGLSQRYNNVWINNSGIPSTEADSRAFSFDILPSSQIDNMIVVKSPAPELPADFSGGFIKIETKSFPSKNSFDVSLSGSMNDQTHFSRFYENLGSGTDFLGFDNGKRSISGGLSSRLENDNSAAVTDFTRNGFNNDWRVKRISPLPDMRLNTSLNRVYKDSEGRQWALTSALNYTNSYKTYSDMLNARYSTYNDVNDKPDYVNRYIDNQYSHDNRLGAMLNVAFSPNLHDRYEFKNTFNQLGKNRYTSRNGYQYISGMYVQERQEYYYSSRTTYNGIFSGDHEYGKNDFDWNIGYAYANKMQPDRRIIDRQENGFVGDVHYGELRIDQNDIERESTKLNEHIVPGSANYKRAFSLGNMDITLKTGVYGEYRFRKYQTRSFNYRWDADNLPSGFEYQDVVNQILVSENYAADKLYIYEETDNCDNYSGSNRLMAGYVSVNIPVGAFNIYTGVRYENNDMKLTSYTSSTEFRTKDKHYRDSRFYPSVNTTYKLTDKQQIRLAYGTSVNRPEFREVSSSVYYDFDLFSDVKGNPNLKTAFIQNADLRYEIYPGQGEMISVALFYKHFKNPIEWTYLDAGGSYTYTFENANSADNYGVELDVRKNLGFVGLPDFSWIFNGALIKSKVRFDAGSLESDRAMQGQSPYLINTGIFYGNQKLQVNANVLYNRIGKRIIGVGRVDTSNGSTINNDIPDAYEMPRNTVDVNFSKKFEKGWELKAGVKDVLAEKVTFKQFPKFYDSNGKLQERQQITKQYCPGRTFYIGVSYNL